MAYARYRTWHDNARSAILSLPEKPDFVIVSGDIRFRNDDTSYQAFNAFCDDLITAEALPPVDRFVVVPGNHDVDRVGPFEDLPEMARWKAFAEAIDRFPHAWLTPIQGRESLLAATRTSLTDTYAGGVVVEQNKKLRRATLIGLPFVFDPAARVLIYGFNSAAISGSHVTLPAAVKNAARWLDEWDHDNGQKWRTIREFVAKRTTVDPAQVRPDELDMFRDVCRLLRERYGARFNEATKIAVLHHHVAPMPAQEIKDFELLLNAADFKREVAEQGFSIICHGHKHRPCEFRDADSPAGARQLIIAGGTVGGDTPREVSPGFTLIATTGGHVTTSFVSIALGTADVQRRASWPADGGGAEQNRFSAPRVDVHQITLEATDSLARLATEGTLRNSGLTIEGWPHRAGESLVTATSTAFALRALRFADPLTPRALHLVRNGIEALNGLRYATGGWSSRYETRCGTPESTGWVALGLRDWGVAVSTDELEPILAQILDPMDPGHSKTYPIAHALTVVAELCPHSPLLASFANTLIRRAMHEDGALIGWPQQMGDDEISAVHTAQACVALAKAARVGGPPVDVTAARQRLAAVSWLNAADEIGRMGDSGFEGRLVIKHYGVALIAHALLELGGDPRQERIMNAIDEIRGAQHNGLWRWPDDRTKPIWMTYTALAALQTWARRL